LMLGCPEEAAVSSTLDTPVSYAVQLVSSCTSHRAIAIDAPTIPPVAVM